MFSLASTRKPVLKKKVMSQKRIGLVKGLQRTFFTVLDRLLVQLSIMRTRWAGSNVQVWPATRND